MHDLPIANKAAHFCAILLTGFGRFQIARTPYANPDQLATSSHMPLWRGSFGEGGAGFICPLPNFNKFAGSSVIID